MIKLASWNINSVNTRLGHILTWLKTHQPDLLLLQELKCPDAKFPYEAVKNAGYHALVKGQPTYNGVAILSREPLTVTYDALPSLEDPQARFLQTSWQDMDIINIYAPNGNPIGTDKFTYKLSWLQKLHAHLTTLRQSRRQFVIGGDFNIIPQSMDAAHPEKWRNDALFQPETREAWRSFLHLDLIDAYRALHPLNNRAFTFWDYQAGSWQRDDGIRIDHFLLAPQLADRLHACTIDRMHRDAEKPSDHVPIVIELLP
jgi:exodeoxyribonuclease III